jgi:hypothetical protein
MKKTVVRNSILRQKINQRFTNFLIQTMRFFNNAIVRNKGTLLNIICLVFVFIFFYQGIYKLSDINGFKLWLKFAPFIHRYKNMISYMAYIIPIAQIIISMLLLIPKYRATSLYITFIALLLYIVYYFIADHFHYMVLDPYYRPWPSFSWIEAMIVAVLFVWLAFSGILLNNINNKPIKKFI